MASHDGLFSFSRPPCRLLAGWLPATTTYHIPQLDLSAAGPSRILAGVSLSLCGGLGTFPLEMSLVRRRGRESPRVTTGAGVRSGKRLTFWFIRGREGSLFTPHPSYMIDVPWLAGCIAVLLYSTRPHTHTYDMSAYGGGGRGHGGHAGWTMDLQGERASKAGWRKREAVADTLHYTPPPAPAPVRDRIFAPRIHFSLSAGCVALGGLHGTSERAYHFGTVCLSGCLAWLAYFLVAG